MRIELPLPAWTETTQRADDDAHTLTVAPSSPVGDWVPWQWAAEPVPSLRAGIEAPVPVTVTITL